MCQLVSQYNVPYAFLTLFLSRTRCHAGITRHRDSDVCQLVSQYNAHRCAGPDAYEYHMLMLESMDADTETRRVSPIGVMDVDDADERYIDLINGPQDHGWCMGYTCQKRLSTFPIVFAASKLRRLLFF